MRDSMTGAAPTGSYRAALQAALSAQGQAEAPPAQAPAQPRQSTPASSRDRATSSPSGSAPSSIVIYDEDAKVSRAPTAEERQIIAAGRQANEIPSSATRFVRWTDEQGPGLAVAPEDDPAYQAAQAQALRENEEARKSARTQRRVGIAIGTGVSVATGVTALRASRLMTTGTTVATRGLGAVAGRVLPGIGAVMSGYGIYQDINHWNDPNNKSKADDVTRIAGNAISMVGLGLMATGVGAPVGLALSIGGAIISGIGSWFDDND